MSTDFYTTPYQWVREEFEAKGRRGVWHFIPKDWNVLHGLPLDFPSDVPPVKHLFGLDVTISDTWTSPPELVSRG